MKLYIGCGHQLRVWMAGRFMTQSALATASRVPKWKISSYTLGGVLTQDDLNKLEATCDAIEKIELAISPARLDCKDGAALTKAVEAYFQGRYEDVERLAVQPKPNPAVITY